MVASKLRSQAIGAAPTFSMRTVTVALLPLQYAERYGVTYQLAPASPRSSIAYQRFGSRCSYVRSRPQPSARTRTLPPVVANVSSWILAHAR